YYPPGISPGGPFTPYVGTNSNGTYATPFYFLLPFIEQNNVYQLGYNNSLNSATNSGQQALWQNNAYTMVVKSWNCPSDPSVTPPGSCPQNPGARLLRLRRPIPEMPWLSDRLLLARPQV